MPEQNVETPIVASKFDDENDSVSASTQIWSQYGYLNQQSTDFNTKKVNYPQNLIIYINQAYLTVKNNKKMYYADIFLLGQSKEAINLPENVSKDVFKDREIKSYRPKYDVSTGQFLGLYGTIGYLVVREDEEEHFLNYGYCEENSEIFYSYHKRRIPNSFGDTFFNKHQLLFETGQLKTDFSNIYFFYRL